MPTFDLLQPIGEDNRPEYFLVEYEGFVRNMAEGLVISLKLELEKYLKEIPGLSSLVDLSPEELYNITNYYEAEQFLYNLFEGKKTLEEIMQLYSEIFINKDVSPLQSIPFFTRILVALSNEDFVKKIYFIRRTNYQDNDIDYIRTSFNVENNKIEIYTGSTEDFYLHHPEVTTVCTSNPFMIKSLCDNATSKEEKTHLHNTLFLLRNNIDTIDVDESTGNIMYKNQEYYETLLKDEITAIAHIDTVEVYVPEVDSEESEG